MRTIDTGDTVQLAGLGFPEALRWRDGALWFSDMFRARVVRWVPGEAPEVILDETRGGPGMPGGLGWLPDGALLVVDCLERRLLAVRNGRVSTHADLSTMTAHPLNDMHVDADGTAWVGGYGFDPDVDAPHASPLYRVSATGSFAATASRLVFPNGCDRLSGDLVVAETFADRLTVVSPTGACTPRWHLPAGSGPDGIAVGSRGELWVALAFARALARIDADGTATIAYTPQTPPGHPGSGQLSVYDCAMTFQGSTLAIACADADEARALAEDTGLIRLLSVAELRAR